LLDVLKNWKEIDLEALQNFTTPQAKEPKQWNTTPESKRVLYLQRLFYIFRQR